MTAVALALLVLTSLCLFAFGVNLIFLSWRSLHLSPAPAPPALGDPPPVCVQIPVYNERYVVERVVDAACAIDWPRDRLQVQVLDDSDDETAAIAERVVAGWRRRGVDITHVRRGSRAGYKAGALAHGMTLSAAPFLAVLDADFVPPRNFLRGLMGDFREPRVAFVQARWGHLNEDYSWFTRLQAIGIDFHFLVEHAVRSAAGYFTNFTGTAGVWRRAAIEDAGGWSAATLTEDLDLSFRAQLRGWRAVYREEVVVPEELPVDINAYRGQQSRWATGSFQAARHLVRPLLAGRQPVRVKWQGAVHLLAYSVGPLMLVQLACYPFLLAAAARHDGLFNWGWIGLMLNLVSLSPWVGFVIGQRRRGRSWWYALPGVPLQLMGAGMSLTVLVAFLRSLRPGGEFRRTPKYRIEARGQEWRDTAYVRVADAAALGEAALAVVAFVVAAVAASEGAWLVFLYSSLMAVGMSAWALLTAAQALQVVTLRRLGAGALRRLRRASGAALLLGPAGLLLAAVAAVGEPFEDSYHHWLIAANLASTGQLHDPLFGMEDSWLPGYHLLAAGVLRLFGLWNLGALKAANVALALVTVALVMRLAGSRRRGRLAAFLLATNPVFLLTAGSVVAEPLLTAELTGVALAAVSGRLGLAAALAAAACLTGTKAWLWVLFAAGALLVGRLPRVAPGRRPSPAWLVPALAVLVLLQLGFAPATHSVARAAAEVTSAAARGSVAGSPGDRLGTFAGTLLLACLPLVVLAPIGFLAELRDPAGRRRLRALHVPALGYLVVVVALVGVGAYTGSHRYLYPALPALAVLAAAGLERRLPDRAHRARPAAPQLAAAVAAGLLAIAYLPVFESFAAANQGLRAAGVATAHVPGKLLTDSPAAAYASRKPPAQITGSRALPADPERALAWLEAGGYTSLVVEDIDYYHASRLFPGLAAGRPEAPFLALGDQAGYRAPGGKTAFAYVLQPPEYQAPLAGDVDACLHPTAQPAAGKTAALQKGLILERGGRPLAGEGMGFGVPVLRAGGTWYFPGTALTADISGPGQVVWRKTFDLDRRAADSPDGRFLRFEPVASQGRIQVTYTVSPGHIAVAAVPLALPADLQALVLLNEESAAFDDFADPTQKLLGPAFGSYQPANGDWARLRSSVEGLEWGLHPIPGARLVAERERADGIDFAGLEYEFGPDFTGAAYSLEVMKAR